MLKYRDGMTAAETAAFMKENDALDTAYAEADAIDAQHAPTTDDERELAAAAEEQSLDYLNRHVAGDRR